MRNPDRIPKVLRELERLWSKHPDWRLGQLIFNIPGRDPFHIEDYDLIELGYRKFGKGEEPNMGDFPRVYVYDGLEEDVVTSSQLGFKMDEEEGE